MFYAVPTSRVMFTVKISLDLFSLGRKQVWTCSVLGNSIYVMKKVTESVWQGINTGRSFCCTSTLGETSTDRESNHKKTTKKNRLVLSSPNCHLLLSAGTTEGLFPVRGRSPSPNTHMVVS